VGSYSKRILRLAKGQRGATEVSTRSDEAADEEGERRHSVQPQVPAATCRPSSLPIRRSSMALAAGPGVHNLTALNTNCQYGRAERLCCKRRPPCPAKALARHSISQARQSQRLRRRTKGAASPRRARRVVEAPRLFQGCPSSLARHRNLISGPFGLQGSPVGEATFIKVRAPLRLFCHCPRRLIVDESTPHGFCVLALS
jgi:hypothetical protein